MASKGQKANWSDITALYAKLTTARTKFGFTPNDVTPASRQGEHAAVDDVTAINSFISEMQANANLTTVAIPITPPDFGSLLKPLFLDTLSNTIQNIENSNNFGNSSFGDSSFSFSNSSFGFSNSSFGAGDGWGDGIAYCWG